LVDAGDDGALSRRSPIIEEPLHHQCWVLSVGVVVSSCSSSSPRWCVALGPAWMLERRLLIVASSMLCRGVWVSALIARAFRSSTSVERGLGADMVCFVLYRFLSSFSYKMATLFSYINEKANLLPSLKNE
jgi:hypothetical protein